MKIFPMVDGPHNIFLLIAFIGITSVAFFTINSFISAYDFVVLDSQLICEQPLNNRCVEILKVKDAKSQIPRNYKPSGYVFEGHDLAIGNRALKTSFSFVYQINGQKKTGAMVLQCCLLLSVV